MELKTFFLQNNRADRGISFINRNTGTQHYVSYEEMVDRALRMGNAWKNHHLRDRFIAVLWMQQSIDMFRAIMAVILAGGIPVPLHPHLPAEEMLEVMKKVEADMVMISSKKAQFLLSVAPKLPFARYVNGETGYEISGLKLETRNDRSYTPPENTAIVLMSSGSTGEPKGIMLSSPNLLSNICSIQEYIELDEHDRVLISKSQGYISTITGEWLTALGAGANIHMTGNFIHPLEVIPFIHKQDITFMGTVPSVIVPLVHFLQRKPQDGLGKLKKLVVSGGALSPKSVVALKNIEPDLQLMPSYGLTEASPRVSYLCEDEILTRPGSVGTPIKQVTVDIYDRNGNPVDNANEEGEIVVNGPNVMLGYYADEKRTGQVITCNGLHTSDMGYFDDAGFIYVTGRKDSALNVGGHTVYPEVIEKQLLNCSVVAEAGVTAVKNEIWGDQIVAFIVSFESDLKKATEVLHRFCQHFQTMYRPREVVIVTDLPKTKSGKLDRMKLKNIVEERDYDENNG